MKLRNKNNDRLPEASQIPDKPPAQKEQISMLWDAVYNHIPTQLRWLCSRQSWQDKKTTFALVMLGLVLALLGVLIFKLL